MTARMGPLGLVFGILGLLAGVFGVATDSAPLAIVAGVLACGAGISAFQAGRQLEAAEATTPGSTPTGQRPSPPSTDRSLAAPAPGAPAGAADVDTPAGNDAGTVTDAHADAQTGADPGAAGDHGTTPGAATPDLTGAGATANPGSGADIGVTPGGAVEPDLDPVGNALVDAQTGLFSEDFFQVALDSRIAAARRHLRPIAMALIEVVRGLPADEPMPVDAQFVADTIKMTLREADTACRLKSGYFALLLEDTPENGAIWTIERIRRQLAETERGLTVWAGIACYPAHAFSPDQLLHAAEQALISARDWRQDRIEVAAATE